MCLYGICGYIAESLHDKFAAAEYASDIYNFATIVTDKWVKIRVYFIHATIVLSYTALKQSILFGTAACTNRSRRDLVKV